MSVQTVVKMKGLPVTLTNPLTATVGVAFGPVITMIDPTTTLNGSPIAWASLNQRPFMIRASGVWASINGTTPSLTVQFYLGGVAGTQIATTGAVAVGASQPQNGSWYLEGTYIWDSVSGLNGYYSGFICGSGSVATAKTFTAVGNVTAATYPGSIAITPTGLFSATGSSNTVTLNEMVIDYV